MRKQGWLGKQLKQAADSVESWPDWMKQSPSEEKQMKKIVLESGEEIGLHDVHMLASDPKPGKMTWYLKMKSGRNIIVPQFDEVPGKKSECWTKFNHWITDQKSDCFHMTDRPNRPKLAVEIIDGI